MAQERSGLVAGIDVGGTFTDLLQLDQATGAVRIAKVPSTPDNQAFGVMNALASAECELAALDLIVRTPSCLGASLPFLPILGS